MIWTKTKLEENTCYKGQLGKFQFLISKSGKTWYLKSSVSESAVTENLSANGECEVDESWDYFIGDRSNTLVIHPSLPDKPVIVRPNNTIRILAGRNIEIYLKIPLWLQFYCASVRGENLLREKPSVELSTTWVGETDNGLLGYAYHESVYLHVAETMAEPWYCICPVKIKNESGADLDFQRLSIHCEQLDLYQKGETLFTNEFRVRYKGEDQVGEIQAINGCPAIAEGGKMIASARNPAEKNLIRRSFYFIRSITQQ